MEATPCPTCGDAPEDTVQGLCASCLLRAALSTRPLPELPGYELISELGRGGMGVVYRARAIGSDQQVALKWIQAGAFATAIELARFRDSAAIAARLLHPNIIRIEDTSHLDDEQPFFTMELIDGGSLAEEAWRRRFRAPDDAAALVITIGRAVHFMHQHGVLHRDLKPENILIDSHERPIVCDFGVAKALSEARTSATGTIVGSMPYMAPEQLAGQPPAVASDIYSLGALFYELLCGRPPFVDDDPSSLAGLIRDDEPRPPSHVVPALPPDFDTVCLCALQKDPARRYASAEAFSDDVARLLRDEPVLARRASALERARRLARRHPRSTAAIGAGSLLVLFVATTAIGVSSMQQEELLRAALDMNESLARAQAGAVLYQLRESGDALEAGARDPRVQAIAARAEPSPVATELAPHARGFDSILIVAKDGRKWARWTTPAPEWFTRRPTFDRDYRRGCMQLLERGQQAAYVARSFRASGDGAWVFALCTPIFAPQRAPLGLLVATIMAASPRAALSSGRSRRDEPITALLGPSEDDRASESGRPSHVDFTFLSHPSLARGARKSLEPQLSAALTRQFGASLPPGSQFAARGTQSLTRSDYRDPILGGRWLAAFAPVGSTGYAVLVESREDVVLRPARQLALRFAAGFGAALGLVLALFSWAVRFPRRRPSARRPETFGGSSRI